MHKWLKYTLLTVLGISLFIVVLPLLLNWLIISERQFEIVGEAKDWLQFWPVYLSAIGTMAMTIATFCTLKANQKQMENMIVSEGAQLVFSLCSDYEYVFLKVTNVGRSVARDIQLRIPNNLAIIERNAGMPFGEGLIRNFNNLSLVPLLLPNQSDYIPLYMYRALGESIQEKDGVKTVEVFGDSYSPEIVTEIGKYFKNQTFTITGYFTNHLDQRHSVSQVVDNTYNVSLAEENKTIEHSLRDLNKNLVGIKNELKTSNTARLKDIDSVLDKMKSELHTIGDSLKKIEGKIKK